MVDPVSASTGGSVVHSAAGDAPILTVSGELDHDSAARHVSDPAS